MPREAFFDEARLLFVEPEAAVCEDFLAAGVDAFPVSPKATAVSVKANPPQKAMRLNRRVGKEKCIFCIAKTFKSSVPHTLDDWTKGVNPDSPKIEKPGDHGRFLIVVEMTKKRQYRRV